MIIFSCKQTAELLSRSRHEPLGLKRRLAMAIHIAICGNCQTYARQLQWMDQAIKQAYDADAERLEADARARIAETLRTHRSD